MVIWFSFLIRHWPRDICKMNDTKNADNSEKMKSSAKRGLSFTADMLQTWHWDEGLSVTEIGRRHGVSPAAIGYWMKKLGVTHRVKLQDVLFEPSPTLAYIYGVIHGDGCLYKNKANGGQVIRLSVIDRGFAESFRDALIIVGIRAKTIQVPGQNGHKPQWLTYATSKAFHGKWDQQSPEERLAFSLNAYPADFIRGLYESEGTVKFHRGRVELAIYNTNVYMQDAVIRVLRNRGYEAKRFIMKLESGKSFVHISLYRSLDIKRFFAWVRPCVKFQPRNVGD